MTAIVDPTRSPSAADAVDVEIVVPVFNEELSLEPSVRRLHAFLADNFPFTTLITIADNASTDATWAHATALAGELNGVRAVHLDEKGRGRALQHVWAASDAQVVAYMDVDLSTDLAALLPLVAPLMSGHSDVAIGSRLNRESRVVRGPKREFISRSYNLILRTTLGAGFSDAQCGFKAMRTECAHALLPHVQDNAWFFDTELLVLAERAGLRIAEIPVDWIDDPDSRVDIVATAIADLRGIARLSRALVRGDIPLHELRAQFGRGSLEMPGVPHSLPRQAIRFATIGVASTLAYLLLYLVTRPSVGAYAANLFALLITAVANTAANRRFTFGVRGAHGAARHQLQGLIVFALGLALTSGSLWLLTATVAHPRQIVEIGVLIGANLTATVLRFVLFREWVFSTARRRRARIALASSRSRPRERVALATLLSATGLLYVWGVGTKGFANGFYAAAVQAGTHSWKAMFFGSFDSANFITVDKPPLALWPMEVSTRIFGFNAWSMLIPQALEGVLTVWLLYATVRRWFGHYAGLLAGALLAITPIVVVMFRYNNPDALMTLLVVAAAYCTTRAIESASTRWLASAGVAMGLAFLAKGLQPLTVLPALALTYAFAAPTTLRRRVVQLAIAGAAAVASAGWWVAAVALTPAADRPYIGGSGDNSAISLTIGYNGLHRVVGSVLTGQKYDGSIGAGRLLNRYNGGQIAWLVPAAVVALVALAYASRGGERTDRPRAALLLWGGWLLITGAVLSFSGGVVHTYYTLDLAPAIAAIVAIGAVQLWRQRSTAAARGTLALALIITGVWSYVLLHRTPTWHPWIGIVAITVAVIGAVALFLPDRRTVITLAVAAGLATLAIGSTAYSIASTDRGNVGPLPFAGPAGARPVASNQPGPTADDPTIKGLSPLIKGTRTRWAAASIGAHTAWGLELATGKPIMAIGGFNGTDNAPTLQQFIADVNSGQLTYFIRVTDPTMAPDAVNLRSGDSAAAITEWVAAHYAASHIGHATVYNLAHGH